MLGHLWQLSVGLLQQSEHTPSAVARVCQSAELPGAPALPVLAITSLFLPAGASQLNLPYGSNSREHFCQKETFSHAYLLKVKVTEKACKNTVMDVGAWMHFHRGFRKTFISRC